MNREINTADEVLDALGGTHAVALLFNIDDRTVSNWRSRGLPPDTYKVLSDELGKIGLTAPAALWRQREAAQ